jgi:hypothetical protein
MQTLSASGRPTWCGSAECVSEERVEMYSSSPRGRLVAIEHVRGLHEKVNCITGGRPNPTQIEESRVPVLRRGCNDDVVNRATRPKREFAVASLNRAEDFR